MAAASPLLLACADRFSTLGEEIRVDRREAIRDSCGISATVLFLAVLVAMAKADNGVELAQHMVVVGMVGLPVVLVKLIAEWLATRRVHGHVALTAGELVVRHPSFSSGRWMLKDGTWRIGKTSDAQFFFRGAYLRRAIVILVFPLEKPLLWTKVIRVPCGLTDEMREVWRAFLTLAGVPHRAKRRGWVFWRR